MVAAHELRRRWRAVLLRWRRPASRRQPTARAGRLHNLFAIPVFAGIPVAAMASAATAVRGRDFGWAGYSATSGLAMVGSSVMFGRAFGDEPRLAGKGGVYQRLSIACGCGWLTALSLRALSYPVH